MLTGFTTFLLIVFIFVILVLIINTYAELKTRQSLSVKSFEKLANELREDNAMMKAELEAMKDTLASINKMMKEIE